VCFSVLADTSVHHACYAIGIVALFGEKEQLGRAAGLCLPSSGKAKNACNYRGADKSLTRPGRKQATATEDFDVHITYLLS